MVLFYLNCDHRCMCVLGHLFLELIKITHDFVENDCEAIVNNLVLLLFSSSSFHHIANSIVLKIVRLKIVEY